MSLNKKDFRKLIQKIKRGIISKPIATRDGFDIMKENNPLDYGPYSNRRMNEKIARMGNALVYHTSDYISGVNILKMQHCFPDFNDKLKLNSGVLFFIDYKNLSIGHKLNNNDAIIIIQKLVGFHGGKVATGSLISASGLNKSHIKRLVDMGFQVYNEPGRYRECLVDFQLFYATYLAFCDSFDERCNHDYHFDSVVYVTSDRNNDNGISFPKVLYDISYIGCNVFHYDTRNDKFVNNILSVANKKYYHNTYIGDIIDFKKLYIKNFANVKMFIHYVEQVELGDIILPTTHADSTVIHKLFVHEKLYLITAMTTLGHNIYDIYGNEMYYELNSYLRYLQMYHGNRVDIYRMAQNELAKFAI